MNKTTKKLLIVFVCLLLIVASLGAYFYLNSKEPSDFAIVAQAKEVSISLLEEAVDDINTRVEESGIEDLELMYDYDYLTTDAATLIDSYLAENGYDETVISISYYNFVTEETYEYNATAQMFAASTYKLPLNMYYYELRAAGTYDGDSKLYFGSNCYADSYGTIANNYSVGDYITLDVLQYTSIVESDNNSSHILFENLGGWDSYMEIISKYSDYYVYCAENYNNVSFMMDCLKIIYENQELYSELIEDMKIAMSGKYMQTYVDEVEIAHKYGIYGTAHNDVGIVFCSQPYALTIYTDLSDGDIVIGEINRILFEYNTLQALYYG